MKKILITLLTIIALPFAANAADYVEGKHYKVIPGELTKKPELREYFSYYCPACRQFESILPDFEKVLPPGAKLTKTHVDFMRGASPEIQFLLSKAAIIAEKFNLDKKFNAEVFNYIQTLRKPITGEADVRKIFIAAGGDGAKFDKGMKSFSIVSQAKRNKKIQDKLSQGRFLGGVPTFVVNGKYAINAKSLNQDNFIEDYKNLITYLFTLK